MKQGSTASKGKLLEKKILAIDKEFLRKSIHCLIGFIPVIADYSQTIAAYLLCFGIIIYTGSEILRCSGRDVYLISQITRLTARSGRDSDIEIGPITLGLGALITLMLYPAPAATIGIYALAFGDSAAGLVGGAWKEHKHLICDNSKTIAGSIACMITVFITSMPFAQNPFQALTLAIGATVFEAIGFQNSDNMLIPLGTGFIATLIL